MIQFDYEIIIMFYVFILNFFFILFFNSMKLLSVKLILNLIRLNSANEKEMVMVRFWWILVNCLTNCNAFSRSSFVVIFNGNVETNLPSLCLRKFRNNVLCRGWIWCSLFLSLWDVLEVSIMVFHLILLSLQSID